jgi:tRNA nucleotidyltransferase/poly(A) polymerase
MNIFYKNKYLKYKNKYIEYKRKQLGGSNNFSWFIKINEEKEIEMNREEQKELEIKYNLGQAVEIIFKDKTYFITSSGIYQYQNIFLRREQKIININENEKILFDKLRNCAEEHKVILRVAGGWVRDKILDLANDDIDIAVDVMTGNVFSEYLFNYINELNNGWKCSQPNIIDEDAEKSKNLETATLDITIPNGTTFELDIVGLRKEVYDNPDSRVPIVTQATVEEDALRRDLTINSLYYNIKTEQIEDYIGGVRDIHRKVIRTPLDPIRTFLDDPLRVLRALRFLCRFRFSLDEMTELAMENQEIKNKLATKISRPRIGKEIIGFFKDGSDPLLGFSKIHEKNLWNIIFGGEEDDDWGNESIQLLNKLNDISLYNILATITYPLYIKDIGKTFRLKQKTSVDNCFSVELCLKKDFEIIVGKIHKCIYKIITVLGIKNQRLWKPSDVALIIIDVEEYLNNMIEVGKTINNELFSNVDCFISEHYLENSYTKQNFDSSLVREKFNLSDGRMPEGRMLGILLKILFAWQFDNPTKNFEHALELKENFLRETAEITEAEEKLYLQRIEKKKEQNRSK